MEYINSNKLCLTYDEYVNLFGLDAYKNDKKRENIVIHGIGGNGRKVLIEYESLQPKRKEVVLKKYGNPYDYLAKQPILDLIDWDYQAHSYYTNYILPNGAKLPATDKDALGKDQINYVDRYTKSVSWLNMLGKFTADKRALKQALNISVMEFWDVVSSLISKQNIDLPTNAKRLKEKLKEFNSYADPEDRYYFIMEKDLHRWSNGNSKKRDEEGEALILKMLSDDRNHDDTVIVAAYNKYARENGKKEYTAGAIGYIRRQNEHILMATRDGSKKAYNKYTKEIGRTRASVPLLLLNSDDNNLDLYFTVTYKDKGGKTVRNNFYRPVLYVVIDTYNDYILGYAYGDSSTHNLIYEAFRNAMNHIHELTGGYYLAHQLQTDRWGLDVKMKNELADFYRKVGGKFTPQAHKVPQGKYIERSFGKEWHQVLKALPFGNYAGHNITAKERRNPEAIALNAKNHPSIEQMPEIIEGFINIMRTKANPKTGVSRKIEWLQAFHDNEKSRKKQIDTATKLSIVGKKRDGLPLTITSKGIIGVFEDQKLRLDLPDEVIFNYNGVKVDAFYDPNDMSQVMITDGKGLRYVVDNYKFRKGAIADYEEGDAKLIQSDWDNKKKISEKLTSVLQEKLAALDGTNIDPESLLQAGVMLKDIKNDNEAAYIQQLYGKKAELPAPISTVKIEAHYEDDSDDDVTNLY
ncbi:hypothetical protein [Sphingobacterium sp. UBA5980]|uniref:hypothetical protein n=1 Tax=Sphingobacterium TaxID=28453 RepID=UPI0025800132|nr:hypothetical protein [Sphingobacterium sp. UBA5980]